MMMGKLARAAWTAAACLIVFGGARAHADTVPGAADRVLVLVNQQRAQAGLAPLTMDPQLNQSAQRYSEYMGSANFYAHDGPDGSTPLSRMNAAGFPGTGTWGENIAAYYSDADSVMQAWMASPGHRANILNPSFTRIGIGVAMNPNSQWKYYWTQDFGVRQGDGTGSAAGGQGSSIQPQPQPQPQPQIQPQPQPQAQPPLLSQVSPTQGTAGDTVTLTGQNFGNAAGSVSFSGITARLLNWSNTRIQAQVPDGASSGAVYVQNSAGTSNGMNFTLATNAPVPAPQPLVTAPQPQATAPQATFIYPTSGTPGSRVTIYGRGFGTSAGQVLFNGVSATVAYWYDTLIGVDIPAGAASGPVVVHTSSGDSNAVQFTVNSGQAASQPQPQQLQPQPPQFPNLQPQQPQPQLPQLPNLQPPTQPSPTGGGTPPSGHTPQGHWRWGSNGFHLPFNQIIPNTAPTTTPQPAPAPTGGLPSLGNLGNGAGASASVGQGVPLGTNAGRPVVTSLSPDSTTAGASFTIQGSNFGTARGWVRLGRAYAQVISWSDTTIVAQVPSSFTISGHVSVRVVRPDFRYSQALYLGLTR